MRSDMNHSNMYVVGLALCTLANIASKEVARDLCDEVERLMGNSNTYVRKKAALCALRIIRKVPSLQENFVDRAEQMIEDKNHGALLTAITLLTDMCEISDETLAGVRRTIPSLVRKLKNLQSVGFSPEHDVTGITDPFLQTKILRLLRVLGHGDAEASELMNDILAQVATNTDASKNVGNAVLYETVLTIMRIESDHALRVLAINILGKFLANKDNNIRYVALTTLNKTVTLDNAAVQRHRNTVLECLRDSDISIRRRALELTYALINESNIRILTRELLAFLEVSEVEFRSGVAAQVCLAADRFAPNRRWHVDTVLRVFKLAGSFVKEEQLSGFIGLVARTTELQGYVTRKLYFAVRSDLSQDSLLLASIWCIGEYGDALIMSTSNATLLSDTQADEAGVTGASSEFDEPITEKDVLNLFDIILQSTYANSSVREFSVTALVKLSTRFTDSWSASRIHELIHHYTSSVEVEVQQRAVEFEKILELDGVSRAGLLERMPAPEMKEEPKHYEEMAKGGKEGKMQQTGKATGPSGGEVSAYYLYYCR